jgi:hypothetical protein
LTAQDDGRQRHQRNKRHAKDAVKVKSGEQLYAQRLFHAMTLSARHAVRRPIAGLCCGLTAVSLLGAATAARAGGQITFGDTTNTSANDGPPFFGFVRDAGGAAVGDARVTATVKSGGALVTTSNSIGVYKISGFAKSISPDDIVISCAKDGYKPVNVVRRPNPPGDMTDPVEVDCYLQKE